jgi:uncharacterized membrane protein
MTPLPPPDTADTGADRRVAATVRVLHRRRGWAWTTVASVVLFLVGAGVTGALYPGRGPGGAGAVVSGVFVLVLAVLTVVGLVTVAAGNITDGVLCYGMDGFVLFCVAVLAHHSVRVRRQLPSRRSLGAPGL